MELFNDSGFEVTDPVFVKIDGKTYHGIVIKIDTARKRIKVDYTALSTEPAIDWFKYNFWTKTPTTTTKHPQNGTNL